MGSCLPSLRRRARVGVLAVPCLCLEESIESPARSGIGLARLNMGLRRPCSVQMAFKFGGVQPPPCPRAFTMAWTGGAMEPRDLTGWLSSPDNIGNHLWSTVQQCVCGRGYLRAADVSSFWTLADGVVGQMINCTNNGRFLVESVDES